MKSIEMPEINGSLRGKPILVPEGWLAPVPVIAEIDRSMRERIASYYQARGLPPLKAEEFALQTVQWTLESAYKKAYGDSIRRYARVYAQTYPHHWRPDGTLAGFDPVRMVETCVPHDPSVGRKGKAIVRQVMRQMAWEATYAGAA